MSATITSLTVLHGGSIFVPQSDMAPGVRGVIEMPVAMFVVEHGDELVLIDTGMTPSASDDDADPYQDLRPDAIVKTLPSHTITQQLAAAGYAPSDIARVVISHGHFDHCGGLQLVDEIPRVVMHRREWEHVQAAPKGRCAPVRSADFEGFDEARLDLFEGDLDLFGDGSLMIIETPGHTPGNCSAIVRLPSRTVLLSGDALHIRAGYEPESVGHIDWNAEAVVASIRRLKHIDSTTEAELWVTHDPGDWRRFTAAGPVLT